MSDEAAEFWEAFEKETGETVVARSMGEWYRGPERDRGLWGLVILTDKAFRFKYMPSENWISSIFKRVNRGQKTADQPVDLVIPRSDIASVSAPKRDFFSRFFGPPFPRLSVLAQAQGGETAYSFSIDPSSGLLAALEKVGARAEEAAR